MKHPLIHLGGRMYFFPTELLLLKAQENYTLIYLKNGKKHLVATTLGVLEERLERYGFLRANRSTLINTDQIKGTLDRAGGIYLQLSNSLLVDVSRRRKNTVLQALS